ncbi:MAG: hypothetical protein DCC65_13730 [Planctomycetota bacterium]|nr:MAG: hypothetical protein DCC65_13730 [Planctomycetota bacterium]
MKPEQDSAREVGCYASLILRLAIAALFFAAAFAKLKGGMETINGTVGYFKTAFAETWLPMWMVTIHAYITPFAEALIAIWLPLGWKLKYGWLFAGLFTISLAFGMSILGKHDIASGNYNYVLMCALGLYLSRFDCLSIDGCLRGCEGMKKQ